MQFIDIKKQQDKIKSKIDFAIQNVLAHGQYIRGPEIGELEKKLASYTGAKYAIACANGTDALQLSLMALNLSEGDEVITTPFTFIATAEVISLLKLKAVFVDIEADTYNIDTSKIEEKITHRTKAIIPVSLYGQVSDMDVINTIAKKHDIAIIEDAAQSFGAEYKGRKSCNLSTMATTSFFPSKPLGCYGDGGMLFTSNDILAEKLRIIANHGQSKRYVHSGIGVNSRLDTLQAAILLVKFDIFDDEVQIRQTVASRYTKALSDFVKTPTIRDNRSSVFAQYTIEVKDRDNFIAKLKDAGVPTAVHYPMPLHLQPAFYNLGYAEGSLPISEAAAKRVVSLPMHPYLSEEDQDKIIQIVKEAI